MNNLNEKQKVFCREYLLDFNATRAAITAGYSKKSAHVSASRMLRNAKVRKYLSQLQKPVLEKFNIHHERIIREYELIAFANIANFFATDEHGFIKTANGLPCFDFNRVHRNHIAGVKCFDFAQLPSSTGNPMDAGFKIKITLDDKLHALNVLALRAGLLRPPSLTPASDQIDVRELAQRIAFMLNKAQEDKKKNGDG